MIVRTPWGTLSFSLRLLGDWYWDRKVKPGPPPVIHTWRVSDMGVVDRADADISRIEEIGPFYANGEMVRLAAIEVAKLLSSLGLAPTYESGVKYEGGCGCGCATCSEECDEIEEVHVGVRAFCSSAEIPCYDGQDRSGTALVAFGFQDMGPAAIKQRGAWLPSNPVEHCHAANDGDCEWPGCPQLRDGEPAATGRDCPYWRETEEW